MEGLIKPEDAHVASAMGETGPEQAGRLVGCRGFTGTLGRYPMRQVTVVLDAPCARQAGRREGLDAHSCG